METSERAGGAVALAVLLLCSGCLAGLGTSNVGPAETPGYPEQPNTLDNSTVQSFALQYERVHLRRQLQSQYAADEFGLGGGTVPKSANVVAARNGTYFVEVQYPYYTDTSGAEADGASHALYEISTDEVERFDLAAGSVAPEDTFRAPSPANNTYGQTIYLANARSSSHAFDVTLTYSETDETAYEFDGSLLAGSSLQLTGTASRIGQYRLTVTTDADASVTRGFALSDSQHAPLFVVLAGDGLLVVRDARRNATGGG